VTVRAFFGFGAQFICGFPTMTKLKEVTPSKSNKVKQVNLSLKAFSCGDVLCSIVRTATFLNTV
jgi:hypothetical protein